MCCLTLPQTLALFASNACPLCLKRYHPPLQTFASDSDFFFRVTMRCVVFLSLRGFVLDTAVCVGAAERCL